jgi:Ser/Thr protein kinase RdoA (MazF antagonist)
VIRAVPLPSRVVDGVRTRFGSAPIEDATLREVLARYGLRPDGRARDLGGHRSRNVLVGTQAGPKVVKRYRGDWRAETIAVGHSVLGRLAERGVVAPRVLATRPPEAGGNGNGNGTGDGPSAEAVTQVEIDGARYAVFEQLHGRSYASTSMPRIDRLRLMALAGATLARWHAALEGFRPEGRHHLGFVGYEGPRIRGLEWYRRSVEDLRRDKVGSARLRDGATELLERIEAGDAVLGPPDLPRRVIHGDFGLHNVLIDGGTAAILDVELARIDHRLTDLLLVIGKHVDHGEPDPEMLATFFDAYGPVQERELISLDDAWRVQCATSAVRSWRSAASAGSAEAAAKRVAAAHRALDKMSWASEHRAWLRRWFGVEEVPARA